jgi:phosphoribosyl 1,2-cyclic phosphodiesterase
VFFYPVRSKAPTWAFENVKQNTFSNAHASCCKKKGKCVYGFAEIGFSLCCMSVFISALASGSNGNCYYVGNRTEAVLIDAGISCREVEKRMARLKLPIQNVKALFVSHEHTDHTNGVAAIAKKYNLPIYLTAGTLRHSGLRLASDVAVTISDNKPVTIGSFSILSFSKAHDAAEPHSFVVSCNGVTVGVFTDIGTPCARLIRYFSECHAAFLEANYDGTMLLQGSYPAHLKARIRGGNGHLSNTQALELFKKHRPAHMSHLVLSHLSKNNNCPKLVSSLFTQHARGTEIVVASRYQETPVYAVQAHFSDRFTVPAHYNTTVSQLAFSFP